ncbi:MAG: hypothetical protein RSF79_26850 [Janthinobacterium sp.]
MEDNVRPYRRDGKGQQTMPRGGAAACLGRTVFPTNSVGYRSGLLTYKFTFFVTFLRGNFYVF